MKKLKIKKLATVLAVAMLLSLAMPVLALAAPYFGNADGEKHTVGNPTIWISKDGEIEGYLYTDAPIHDVGVSEVVYNAIGVQLDRLGTPFTVEKAVYDSMVTVSGSVYYKYSFTVTGITYDSIYLSYEDTVSDIVYRKSESKKPGRGGYPIGFFPGGSSGECTLDLGNRTEVSAFDLRSNKCDDGQYVISTDGDYVVLPANALAELVEKNAKATVTIVTPNGSYKLPLSVFDFDALAEAVNTNLNGLKIRVDVKQVSDSVADEIERRAQELGLEVIADAVDFAVTAVGPSSSQEITSFGNTYVERVIPLNKSVNPNTATAAVYNPETGAFSFVPSVFWEDDGDAYVTLKRNSNSIYTAVAQNKTFRDVPAGHWAEEDIHTLANKLVVYGVSDDLFDLRRNVTRAEFAGLVVRSLGLGGIKGSHSFSDVPANAWYAEEVAIATEAGLIYGYEDGTFRPNEVITREELASLVVRALEYAGFTEELSPSEQSALLAPFKDADQVGGWAREEMARAIKEGIVYGMSEDTLNPKGNATRAEAAAMLYRYLQAANFINE